MRQRKLITWMTVILSLVLVAGCGTKTSTSDPSGSISMPKGQTETTAKKSWSNAPEMTIDVNKTYTANVTTSKGSFKIALNAKDAPKTVNNFVFLANQKFYDNIIFHRIIETFMIQTGDPLGNGTGGPGYKFEDELHAAMNYEPGVVAMANSGENTNGSQFFICTGEDSKLLNQTPNYTIFGKVTEGMDVIQAIAKVPVGPDAFGREMSAPKEKVTIQSIVIEESK